MVTKKGNHTADQSLIYNHTTQIHPYNKGTKDEINLKLKIKKTNGDAFIRQVSSTTAPEGSLLVAN